MAVRNYWLVGITHFMVFIITDGLNVDVTIEKQELRTEF